MLKRTQPRVIGEEWSDERVRAFLNLQPHDESDPDFYVLIRAYQSMREDDFARFIKFFMDSNRNINAKDKSGQTILEVVASHRCSSGYAESLRQAGAK